MLEQLFSGLFAAGTTDISIGQFLCCLAVALVIGLLLAAAYTYGNRYSKSFTTTLALLPGVVCVVILMVSGNLGAGVAVAGTFSLVRFRSVPGTAKEICAVFLAMAAGLVVGMGYLAFSFVFALIMAAISILYTRLGLLADKQAELRQTLRITIPEDLDYQGVFDDLFAEYADQWRLLKVKTTNLGSLYKLTYEIVLKQVGTERDLIDRLRCRNGNLEISCSRQAAENAEL